MRKSISEIPDVIAVVRRAFFDAALAGLALTLLLGIPLSGRLVRRLHRLREAAIEVEHDSPEAVVPVDLSRDEVGDLARSLAAMQQRLRGQEQARRSFVATASHELRTPLTSLDGMLELLDEYLLDPEPDLHDARDLLARARAQSRRLGRLAAALLDLSRIDAQVELRSEPIELCELSRAVLAEFELSNAERSIHSVLEEGEGALWAGGDPGSIARILRILLDNAQRASPPQSHVRIVLSGGRLASISVGDEGPGVPAEAREAIFERFNRGRETAGQGGFGLGLAIGRELARRMGGELRLEPDGPGATFTRARPPPRPRGAHRQGSAAGRAGTSDRCCRAVLPSPRQQDDLLRAVGHRGALGCRMAGRHRTHALSDVPALQRGRSGDVGLGLRVSRLLRWPRGRRRDHEGWHVCSRRDRGAVRWLAGLVVAAAS